MCLTFSTDTYCISQTKNIATFIFVFEDFSIIQTNKAQLCTIEKITFLFIYNLLQHVEVVSLSECFLLFSLVFINELIGSRYIIYIVVCQ